MTSRLRFGTVVLSFLLSGLFLGAEPVDRAELDALRARVRELEEQVRALVLRLDIDDAQPENGKRNPAGPLAGARGYAKIGNSKPETRNPEPIEPLAGARGYEIGNPKPETRNPKPSGPLAGARSYAAGNPNPGYATVTDRGYTLASTEGENAIRLHGLVQLDARAFFNDADAATDTFTLRRARLISDGVLAKNFGFQFVTEFGGHDVSIRDASLTVRLSDAVQLKAGKFKPPFGLELLQQGYARPFIERSLVTNLVPVRDLGVQLGGDVLDQRVSYAVGVFNGVVDGGIASHTDSDGPKDLVGRVMLRPFNGHFAAGLRALAVGVAGTHGRQNAAAGHLPLYRTDGQQVFFAYGQGVAVNGEVSRLSPQFDYRLGPLTVTGEYVTSSADVQAPAGGSAALRHRGWQLTTGWVLTGEDASFAGLVPHVDFNPRAGTWGAFEVVARVGGVEIDGAAFSVFAAPESSATELRAAAFGLNWHLSKAVRFMFNYVHTDFDVASGQPVAPLLRQGERLFASRLQLAF